MTKNYPMHRCNTYQLEKFNPPDYSSKDKIEKYKKDGGLFCFDLPPEASEIFGYWQAGSNYAALDIIAAPCGHQYELEDGTMSKVREDCNWDQQAAIDYFGTIGFLVYYNEGVFKQDDFGQHRVSKQSYLKNISTDPGKPMYIPSFIDKYLLEDEISLLQYGQTEEIDFESIRLEAPEPSLF